VTQDTSQAADVFPEGTCPIPSVVDVLFSRWTTPIMWALNEFGRQRFGDLERRIPAITAKVLTQRLRQLERDGLVIRTYYAGVPPRVEYEVSALGRSLGKVFEQLTEWGAANLDEVEAARQRYDAAPQPGTRRPA
jgi:DNA-binding HxlR family transcriptional regulator